MGQGFLSLGGLEEAFGLTCLPQRVFDLSEVVCHNDPLMVSKISALEEKNHVAIGKNRFQTEQNRAVHKHILTAEI